MPVKSQFKELRAHILDDSGNPQELDFGQFDRQKVCLRFHYYANGSTSQMILEEGDTFYFLPSYFGKIETFDSIDEAVERWVKYRTQLNAMGTYF